MRVVRKVHAGAPFHLRVVARQQEMVADVERVESHLRSDRADLQDLRPTHVVRRPGRKHETQLQPLGGDRWTLRHDSTSMGANAVQTRDGLGFSAMSNATSK